jgi:hypothetical protein
MKKLILATALLAGSAHAEFLSGNELLSRINGTGIDQALALGYVMGVFDVQHSSGVCPPGQVTAGQVRDIVKNYLERTPQNRHMTADVLTLVALGIVWPCKQQKGNGV